MKIFSFDLGSGSIGECVRENDKILHLESLLIDSTFASTKEQAGIRRAYRTRLAHKAREEWWAKCAKEAGIEVLKSAPQEEADIRLLREFPAKGDDTIYTSCLLRIALLQGKDLEGWQIYKAIRSAIQHRGYDDKLPWESGVLSELRKKPKEDLAPEEKKRLEEAELDNKNTNAYTEELKKLITDENLHYPCYYEALKLGLWNPQKPKELKNTLSCNPLSARNKEGSKTLIAPRELVIKEVKELLIQAVKQCPKLGNVDDIMFPGGKAYSAFKDKENKKYRGRAWEWQGILGQKTPRFDNRIISKCRLIPRLNVCKAEDD
ncbi:MAG: hypothetical protein LBM71_02090, partial [Elusimicrobiota bacterium]|nr:hypothetical protein [Elusimicrobiota bacterium]